MATGSRSQHAPQSRGTASSEERQVVFIGDVHGQAATLLALLDQLGWRRRAGRLRGPGGSLLVFVGDLIDRGPENRRTVEIVRDLVERGEAVCLLGNHEYNAVQFHTPDPDRPGKHLREQSDKNVRQHAATLAEFANDPAALEEMIAWFRTLPVAVEGSGWRCVHACWDPDQLELLEADAGAWYLPPHRWLAAARSAEPEYRAIEVLTKGPERTLPAGATFEDKDGNVRHEARLKWWARHPRTLGEAFYLQGAPEGLEPTAPYRGDDHAGYPDDAPPVLFGHYWYEGDIRLDRPNAACLDYSAGKGDRLVGYRLTGERRLVPGRFIVQPVL